MANISKKSCQPRVRFSKIGMIDTFSLNVVVRCLLRTSLSRRIFYARFTASLQRVNS